MAYKPFPAGRYLGRREFRQCVVTVSAAILPVARAVGQSNDEPHVIEQNGTTMPSDFPTIKTRRDARVLFATFDSPPINLIGPQLVRDLISLLDSLELTRT